MEDKLIERTVSLKDMVEAFSEDKEFIKCLTEAVSRGLDNIEDNQRKDEE